MSTSIDRELPNDEARELMAVVEQVADQTLRPIAAEHESAGTFPRDVFATLGQVGLLGMPYPAEYGGADLPYVVYLQVIEELSRAWLAVGLGVSVHTLSAHALANFGTADQQQRWLPEMIGGDSLGAYCLSESQSGSDAAGLTTNARRTPDGYELTGTKAWITHGGEADFYTVMARTSPERNTGISCFLVPGDAPGLTAATPENKMGMRASTTAQVNLDHVQLAADRLIGDEGEGLTIALAALDSGRLGIAACAVGLAQSALDEAIRYSKTREQFGQPISDFQGIGFMIADMATAIESARALYLSAARRKDDARPYSTQAAMAKLAATDACMQVAIDTVQILGGAGFVEDFPAERYFREAKVLQIVEGTNQIQRHVIARNLLRG